MFDPIFNPHVTPSYQQALDVVTESITNHTSKRLEKRMTNSMIKQRTLAINELLNLPGLLQPTGCQYRWANEQDSWDELWLICGSFISDINQALSSFNLKPLEAQLNYGGLFIDNAPQCSTTIQLNRERVSNQWLLQLREAIGALYVCVSPLHNNRDPVSFYPLGLSLKPSVPALLKSQTKAQLSSLALFSIVSPFSDELDTSEHDIWVSSIALGIELEKRRHQLEQSPFQLFVSVNALMIAITKTQTLVERLYELTAPFPVTSSWKTR